MYRGSARDREVRRARQARYRASGKHHEAIRRYRQTAKGKAANKRSNAKQLKVANQYVGYCADRERANAIRAHLQKRLVEFRTTQKESDVTQ